MIAFAYIVGLVLGFALGVAFTVFLAREAVRQGKLWTVHKREER